MAPTSTNNNNSMNYEILAIQKSSELSPQLRQIVRQKGFPTLTITDFPEIPKALKDLKAPIILFLGSQEASELASQIKMLENHPQLRRFPLIVTGAKAQSFEAQLNQSFLLAIGLDGPPQNKLILDSIAYVASIYSTLRERKDNPAPPAAPKAPSAPRKVTPPVNFQATVEDILARASGIPSLIFSTMEKLDILNKKLSGENYNEKLDQKAMFEKGYLPEDPELLDASEETWTAAGKWGQGHIFRTAFLTIQVAEALKLPAPYLAHARVVPFLYSWSFSGSQPDLLRKDIVGAPEVRQELSKRIRESGSKVAEELQEPELGQIITALGNLVSSDTPLNDEPASLLASTVMACDYVDRACFSSGSWNAQSAYRLLTKLKKGSVLPIPITVLACLVKLLSESISSQSPAYLLPKKLRDNKELKEEARRMRNMRVNSDETKVALASLLPGMRLSRPLRAFDGQEILDADVRLDQDLIWRIWQLAAIRPVNSPAIIHTEPSVPQT